MGSTASEEQCKTLPSLNYFLAHGRKWQSSEVGSCQGRGARIMPGYRWGQAAWWQGGGTEEGSKCDSQTACHNFRSPGAPAFMPTTIIKQLPFWRSSSKMFSLTAYRTRFAETMVLRTSGVAKWMEERYGVEYGASIWGRMPEPTDDDHIDDLNVYGIDWEELHKADIIAHHTEYNTDQELNPDNLDDLFSNDGPHWLSHVEAGRNSLHAASLQTSAGGQPDSPANHTELAEEMDLDDDNASQPSIDKPNDDNVIAAPLAQPSINKPLNQIQVDLILHHVASIEEQYGAAHVYYTLYQLLRHITDAVGLHIHKPSQEVTFGASDFMYNDLFHWAGVKPDSFGNAKTLITTAERI
ncbi:hypothetical protein B0H14DRAFT_2621319 [Mycena olivaceomarginata]|nr:hypothetical protein B0H14DRAFT_2621319 [Mycena olivaceomarginata]